MLKSSEENKWFDALPSFLFFKTNCKSPSVATSALGIFYRYLCPDFLACPSHHYQDLTLLIVMLICICSCGFPWSFLSLHIDWTGLMLIRGFPEKTDYTGTRSYLQLLNPKALKTQTNKNKIKVTHLLAHLNWHEVVYSLHPIYCEYFSISLQKY